MKNVIYDKSGNPIATVKLGEGGLAATLVLLGASIAALIVQAVWVRRKTKQRMDAMDQKIRTTLAREQHHAAASYAMNRTEALQSRVNNLERMVSDIQEAVKSASTANSDPVKKPK